MKRFIFPLLFAPILGYTQARITPWFNNKQAAAVITFDDNCPGQFQYALPALNNRSLPATFFVITGGSQCGTVDWNQVNSAYAAGHEIASHSVTHGMLRNMDTSQIRQEMASSFQAIKSRFPNQKGMTIAWPFGQGGGSPLKDDTIRRIAASYYFAARSAGIGARGYIPYDDFNNAFYQGRSFYHMLGTYLMSGSILPSTIGSVLDSTIKYGGWYTCLYHGIEDVGVNLVPLTRFEQTLASIKSRENDLWITTLANSAKYHTQRRFSNLVFEANGNNYQITVNSSLPDSIFNHPLTVRITSSQLNNTFQNLDQVQLRSNSNLIPFFVEGDSVIQFNATAGVIFELFGGSTDLKSLLFTKNAVSISPNPLQGKLLNIEFKSSPRTLTVVKLKTMKGQQVETFELEPNQITNKKVSLGLHSHPAGLYLLETSFNGSKQTTRVAIID